MLGRRLADVAEGLSGLVAFGRPRIALRLNHRQTACSNSAFRNPVICGETKHERRHYTIPIAGSARRSTYQTGQSCAIASGWHERALRPGRTRVWHVAARNRSDRGRQNSALSQRAHQARHPHTSTRSGSDPRSFTHAGSPASPRISSISQIIAGSDIARGWDATAISSSGNCSGNSKTLSR